MCTEKNRPGLFDQQSILSRHPEAFGKTRHELPGGMGTHLKGFTGIRSPPAKLITASAHEQATITYRLPGHSSP